MGIRTDLAVEVGCLNGKNSTGISKNVEEIDGVKLIEIEIETEEMAKELNKPKGSYITLEHSNVAGLENFEVVEDILVDRLTSFFENKSSILVVGLGNRNISPDAVGPLAAEKIIASRHLNFKDNKLLEDLNLRSVVVLLPGVLSQTGIEATELVSLVSKKVKPNLVLAIDALAARSLNRIGTTIQLTNTGIAPGSGVENKRLELSEKILDVPVLAIGVPTVVDMQTAVEDFCGGKGVGGVRSLMVTARNIDKIVSESSGLISNSINRALYPNLSEKELKILAC